MNLENQILSDITIYMKYARYLKDEGRRETWQELVDRNMNMHLKKYPQLTKEIIKVYQDFVLPKKVLPSMRSLQFAGRSIDVNPARIFNCSNLIVNSLEAFSETMLLLLSGCGVGYSIQKHHVEQLPEIRKPNPNKARRYLVGDSIEGWADAVKVLLKSYFGKRNSTIDFDFRDIRPKGAELVTSGGKAPGAQPLKECLLKIRGLLDEKEDNEKLTPIECHDIQCHIADAVLAGGIRRAAMIALFSFDDEEMLSAKAGNWWELNSQRGRANNSAVVLRHKITKTEFDKFWNKIKLSGSGEPGISFSNDKEMGFNPCFSGNGKLLTVDGEKTFEELCDKEGLKIINSKGNIVESKVWCSGEKETVVIKNRLKEEFVCTPDHVWKTADGFTVEAEYLKGKRLMPYLTQEDNFDDLYVKLGFIQGDGGLGRLKSDIHRGFEIHMGEKDGDMIDFFGYIKEKENQRSWYTREFYDICKNLGFSDQDLPNRILPSTFKDWSERQKISFIRGLYSANGSVINKGRVSFKTTCLNLVLELQDFFDDFGISTYYTTNKSKKGKFKNGTYTLKESYDLNIGQFRDIVKFYEKIGFVHKYKTESLHKVILNKSPQIMSVKKNGIIRVYDFTEPETHWGVVNGYIAHNCHEISLKPFSFCNLVEVNASDITDQKDLDERAEAASFIGTLQAGYTDFHYLREVWKKNSEKDALIGVSMTGIANTDFLKLDLKQAGDKVVETNKMVAEIIGINPAARATCVKPAGTTSLVLGTSSGIHAWHNDFYIRRIRVNKTESIYNYIKDNHPELITDDVMSAHNTAVIEIPQKAPEGAILRNESALNLLERIKHVSQTWIEAGHTKGSNKHNVSATVSIKDDEWKTVRDWMWENRDHYNGLSVLPYDTGTYTQTPFEDIDEGKYNEMLQHLTKIDLSKISEANDETNLSGEIACSGGSCTIENL